MRVTAAEILRKEALQPPAQPGQMQAPLGGAAEPPASQAAGELETPQPGTAGGQQPAQGNGELTQITQALLTEYFDDAKIADASDKIQQLIPIVGPEHAEKFVKVYTDWVKAAMTMKANLMSIVVMNTPQQIMQQQVNQLMQQITQQGKGGPAGQNVLKTNPIT